MAYNPVTDFIALLRLTNGAVDFARMPGLDYVISAMARAGMFTLYSGQTEPIVDQETTVWIKPAQPSWTAEGVVYLWDASAGAYAVATPALWAALLAPGGYLFQSATGEVTVIEPGVTVLAIQRTTPATSSLVLPRVGAQWTTGRKLKIVDWSTGVAAHQITLSTPDGATFNTSATWRLFSTADQRGVADLTPVPDVNGWIVE